MRGKDKMRAFGYVRLSRLRKGDDGENASTSPARQREIIERVCKERGWRLVEVFEDLDVSGAKESRPELDKMMGRLSEADVIVAWKLDRIGRSLPHLLQLVKDLQDADVQLVLSDGEVDTTTAGGRMFLQMRGVFAEYERSIMSERSLSLHAYLRAQGRVQSRLVPYGFRKTRDNRLERNPETWPVLVSMMERVAAGESLRRVAADQGVSHTVVRVYARSRHTIGSLEEDRPELAAALRARLQDETFRPGARSLLAGLARCNVCGDGLRQSQRAGSRVYGCRAGHVYVEADWLDGLVVRDVLRLSPWAPPRRRAKEGPSRDERAALERKLEKLQDEYDDDLMTEAHYVRRRDRILEKLGRTSARPAPRLQSVKWEELTHDERRLALREVLERVEVGPVPKGKSRTRRHASRVALSFR